MKDEVQNSDLDDKIILRCCVKNCNAIIEKEKRLKSAMKFIVPNAALSYLKIVLDCN
jgi:hypothetical protein